MKLLPAPEHAGMLALAASQAAMKRRTRLAITVTLLLFLFVLVAAATVPIGGAVIGGGQLGVESRVKRIAHPTGGVITEIHARDGQRVSKGALLMRLDTKVSGARADLSSRSVDQLLAERARLEAEREGRDTIDFPEELTSRKDASARDAMATETRLHALKQAEQSGLRAQYAERLAQLEQQIRGYEAQITAAREQQALIEPERKGIDELWKRGLVTITRRNQIERAAVDLAGSIASLNTDIAQTRARQAETRELIVSLGQSARSDAGTELARINGALNDQRAKSVSAGDDFERTAIRAPYDGVIDKLAYPAIGDVVRPAEPIMEIVPVDDELVVEAAIKPGDIDDVKNGQDARVRLTALNARLTPEISGKVVFVAAERTERENGESFFHVRIALDREEVAREKIKLIAGMPVEVFIATGSRSMLSYITKPLRDQFARSFRD